MVSSTRDKLFVTFAAMTLAVMAVVSLFVGKYPLTVQGIVSGDPMQQNVFLTLRLSRTVLGVVGGFCLGIAGFVYQTVFRNPLASPDIIGVASGASAGAAAGILFLSGTLWITAASFVGALAAVLAALALASVDKTGRSSSIVLSGIAVHALAQTVLMALKLTADPEKELSSIEYWIMGSLNGVRPDALWGNFLLCLLCAAALFLLHRQILLLSAREDEAKMLGAHVPRLRLLVLLTATLMVACVISLTGLVSFVGLLAPHGARLLTGRNHRKTMLLSGLLGSSLLCGADILARSVAQTELPVSIFTSLLGAPFLIWLLVRRARSRSV
ncbi:MAG: iron ABC transporter permease [Oscillospiraceae bacterium]|nr:iron ABC transporter permease [Oscillospiraceae bacterium]